MLLHHDCLLQNFCPVLSNNCTSESGAPCFFFLLKSQAQCISMFCHNHKHHHVNNNNSNRLSFSVLPFLKLFDLRKQLSKSHHEVPHLMAKKWRTSIHAAFTACKCLMNGWDVCGDWLGEQSQLESLAVPRHTVDLPTRGHGSKFHGMSNGGRAGTPACATDPGKVSGHFFPLLPQVPHWQANSSFSCVEQTPQIHCGHVCQTVSYTYTHGFLWKNVFPCRCKTFRALTEFSVRKTALQPKLPGSLYLFIHSTNFSENIPCLNA